MSDTNQLSEKTIGLLESIDESVRELDSPSLHRLDGEARTVGRTDAICGVCGGEHAYGNTWITTHFEFDKTPERQENDRVCPDCLGRYLDLGDWEDVEGNQLGQESVEGLLRLARNSLKSANMIYGVRNDEEVWVDGERVDLIGVLDMVDRIDELMQEHGDVNHD